MNLTKGQLEVFQFVGQGHNFLLTSQAGKNDTAHGSEVFVFTCRRYKWYLNFVAVLVSSLPVVYFSKADKIIDT